MASGIIAGSAPVPGQAHSSMEYITRWAVLTRGADDRVDAVLAEAARHDGPRDVVTWLGPLGVARAQHRAPAVVRRDEVHALFRSCAHQRAVKLLSGRQKQQKKILPAF